MVFRGRFDRNLREYQRVVRKTHKLVIILRWLSFGYAASAEIGATKVV